MTQKVLPVLISSALLSACGGGGGSSDSSDSNTPSGSGLTGNFVDSPVKGLRYTTPTRTGLTDANGTFEYLAGEQVTFSVGGTVLGVAVGDDTITPFTLKGIKPLETEYEIVAAITDNELRSYDVALNIAALLQGLDADGNPDNGIDLSDADAVLANDEVNLLIKATAFEDDVKLARVKNKMGVDEARTLQEVANHIYESLQVEVKSSTVAGFSSTVNYEGKESVSYEYDANGNVIAQNTDVDNDGVIDYVKSYIYDSDGNLIQTTNSATNTSETLTYDNANNLITRFIDNAAGDDIRENYTYTANNLVRFELDKNADGSPDSLTNYAYDQLGNMIRYEIDQNADGQPDSIASYVFEGDLVATYSEDRDNDGIPNQIIAYTYDENGNRLSHNLDIDDQGTPSVISRFDYDNSNNVIRYEQDRDIDGLADYVEDYKYDQNNNRIEYRRDIDADGTWEFVAQYRYDQNGNRTRMVEDNDGDGIVDKIWTGNYQAAVLENSWQAIIEKL